MVVIVELAPGENSYQSRFVPVDWLATVFGRFVRLIINRASGKNFICVMRSSVGNFRNFSSRATVGMIWFNRDSQ
jgi:hypothetical protein